MKNRFSNHFILYLSMIVRFVFFLGLIIFFYSGNAMAQEKQKIYSWIEKDTQTENLRFNAFCRNESKDIIKDLSYQFNGWKQSETGSSNISQSGKFEAEPGKKISLSTLELNNIQKGMLNLKLEIFYKDSLIATDSLEIKR